MLTARPDSLRNVFRLRRRQHKYHVTGRLLQCLQQSVKCRIRDLVGLVENIDFETIACRTIACSFAQFPDLINATIGGGVNLDHINRISGSDFGA